MIDPEDEYNLYPGWRRVLSTKPTPRGVVINSSPKGIYSTYQDHRINFGKHDGLTIEPSPSHYAVRIHFCGEVTDKSLKSLIEQLQELSRIL